MHEKLHYKLIEVWYTEYFVSIEIQEPHRLYMQKIYLGKKVFFLTALSFTFN